MAGHPDARELAATPSPRPSRLGSHRGGHWPRKRSSRTPERRPTDPSRRGGGRLGCHALRGGVGFPAGSGRARRDRCQRPGRSRSAGSRIPGPARSWGRPAYGLGNRAADTGCLFADHTVGQPHRTAGSSRHDWARPNRRLGVRWRMTRVDSHMSPLGVALPRRLPGSPATTHLSPPATGIAVGEPDWVDGRWTAGSCAPIRRGFSRARSASARVRSGSRSTMGSGSRHLDGTVTRFDPRPSREDIAAVVRTPLRLARSPGERPRRSFGRSAAARGRCMGSPSTTPGSSESSASPASRPALPSPTWGSGSPPPAGG